MDVSITTAATCVIAFFTLVTLLLNHSFHAWVKSQRQPKPIFISGQASCPPQPPVWKKVSIVLLFNNPGEVSIIIKWMAITKWGDKKSLAYERHILNVNAKPRELTEVKVELASLGEFTAEELCKTIKPGQKFRVEFEIGYTSGTRSGVLPISTLVHWYEPLKGWPVAVITPLAPESKRRWWECWRVPKETME